MIDARRVPPTINSSGGAQPFPRAFPGMPLPTMMRGRMMLGNSNNQFHPGFSDVGVFVHTLQSSIVSGTGGAGCPFLKPSVAGSLLVVYVYSDNTSGVGTYTVPDNHWLQAVYLAPAGGYGALAIFYWPDAPGGMVNTGSFFSTIGANGVVVGFEEVAGFPNGGGLDRTQKRSLNVTPAGTPTDSGTTAVTRLASEYLAVGSTEVDSVNGPDAFQNPTNSFKLLQQHTIGVSNSVQAGMLSRIVAATSTYNGGCSFANAGGNICQTGSVIATFSDVPQSQAVVAGLFMQGNLDGLGSGGAFFVNPLGA